MTVTMEESTRSLTIEQGKALQIADGMGDVGAECGVDVELPPSTLECHLQSRDQVGIVLCGGQLDALTCNLRSDIGWYRIEVANNQVRLKAGCDAVQVSPIGGYEHVLWPHIDVEMVTWPCRDNMAYAFRHGWSPFPEAP